MSSTTYTVFCTWLPANNFLFQIANIWLCISYLCPPTLNGLLYLRLSLGLAGFFFGLWGWLVLCAPDTALWNLFFFIGNFIHLGYLLFARRTKRFSDDLEQVYVNIFQPLHLPRHQFQYLALADSSFVKRETLSAGKILVIDGVTECEALSILVKGRVDVRKHGKTVHVIEEYQFLNSPEWVVSQNGPYTFEVTMTSITECQILSWDRKMLLNILQKNIYLRTVLDSVISKDIAQKVFAMNRLIKARTGLTHSIYSLNELDDLEATVSTPQLCIDHDVDKGHGDNDDDHHTDIYNCESKLLNSIYTNEKETTI